MGKIVNGALALGLMVSTAAHAESNDASVARLYQIGSDGKYCLSITKDTSGCVSGENDGGKNLNVLDFIRGKRVVFENLSDAPHDMKFSGANQQDLPVQAPGGADAQKQLAVVDLTAQKISCSFHGAQLGVGYRVPNASGSQVMEGHKEVTTQGRADFDVTNEGGGRNAGASAGPSQKIVRTGLADVAAEVLTKGRQADVEKLVTSRPDLMAKLQELRPLLAQEIAANAGGSGTNAKVTTMGVGNGSSNLDANFGAKGEGQGGAPGSVAGGGAGGGKPGSMFAAGGAGSAGGISGGDAAGGGVGRKDVKRLLVAANNGEEDHDNAGEAGSSPGWASSILGMPTEKRDEGRGLASASLGSLEGTDRTSLKTVLKNKKKLPGDDNSSRNRWLLVALVAAIAISSRWVFRATAGKKDEEEDQA